MGDCWGEPKYFFVRGGGSVYVRIIYSQLGYSGCIVGGGWSIFFGLLWLVFLCGYGSSSSHLM